MKYGQLTEKALFEFWQDALLANRFRRTHSKTNRKIQINTIYYTNSGE